MKAHAVLRDPHPRQLHERGTRAPSPTRGEGEKTRRSTPSPLVGEAARERRGKRLGVRVAGEVFENRDR